MTTGKNRLRAARFQKPERIPLSFGFSGACYALIRMAVEKLCSPEGGLMLGYGLYPGMPLANVKAVMDAMEKSSLFYS